MIKIAHFIWVGRMMRPLNQLVMDHNFKEFEGTDWEVKLWTDDISNIPERFQKYVHLLDHSFLDSIKSHPCVLNTRDGEFRFPHYVDLIRYNILIQHGGLYCDTDDFLLGDPSQFIDFTRLNVIQESARWLTNSLIYTPIVQDPDLIGIWNWIMDKKVPWTSWANTGPLAVTYYLYYKYELELMKHKSAGTINFDSTGWPRIADLIEHNLYQCVNIIPDKIFPLKWTKFQSMIRNGIPFDTEEYRQRGFAMLGMFGSVDTRGDHFPDEGVKVTFITNHGPRDVMLGAK